MDIHWFWFLLLTAQTVNRIPAALCEVASFTSNNKEHTLKHSAGWEKQLHRRGAVRGSEWMAFVFFLLAAENRPVLSSFKPRSCLLGRPKTTAGLHYLSVSQALVLLGLQSIKTRFNNNNKGSIPFGLLDNSSRTVLFVERTQCVLKSNNKEKKTPKNEAFVRHSVEHLVWNVLTQHILADKSHDRKITAAICSGLYKWKSCFSQVSIGHRLTDRCRWGVNYRDQQSNGQRRSYSHWRKKKKKKKLTLTDVKKTENWGAVMLKWFKVSVNYWRTFRFFFWWSHK